jgi:hypothetical protein
MKESPIAGHEPPIAHDHLRKFLSQAIGRSTIHRLLYRRRLRPSRTVARRLLRRDNRLRSPLLQPSPQRVALEDPIAHQPLRTLAGPPRSAGPLHRHPAEPLLQELHPAGDAESRYAPSGVPWPSTRTIPSLPSPLLVSPTLPWAPLFGRGEAPIGKALIPAQLLLVMELGQQGPLKLKEYSPLFPLLEVAPAGAGAAISPGELAPGSPRPRDPDALKTLAVLSPEACRPWSGA